MFGKGDKIFIPELLLFAYMYLCGVVWGILVEIRGVGAIKGSLPQPPFGALPDYFFGPQELP